MNELIEKIAKMLVKNNLTISCAESCTGGLLSSAFTDVSGSSEFIKINFVTYANEAKINFVDVKPETLNIYGAVSEQTSFEMAKGLLKYADIGVSTTGIAGPTGGSNEKPIGLMYSTICTKEFSQTKKILLSSNIERIEMKKQFVEEVLKFIYEVLSKNIEKE